MDDRGAARAREHRARLPDHRGGLADRAQAPGRRAIMVSAEGR